jgi:hypothetical protein
LIRASCQATSASILERPFISKLPKSNSHRPGRSRLHTAPANNGSFFGYDNGSGLNTTDKNCERFCTSTRRRKSKRTLYNC